MFRIWISCNYFTFHDATVKDSWPVKTNLSTSKILSTFSHVVSNFFIMHQMETAKTFTCAWTSFHQPSLLCKSYWFYLASDFHPSPFRNVSKWKKSIGHLQFCSRIALPSFLCPSCINFHFWIQHQHLPEIFYTFFDSSRLMHEFQFPTFSDSTDGVLSIPESNNPVQDMLLHPKCHHGKQSLIFIPLFTATHHSLWIFFFDRLDFLVLSFL